MGGLFALLAALQTKQRHGVDLNTAERAGLLIYLAKAISVIVGAPMQTTSVLFQNNYCMRQVLNIIGHFSYFYKCNVELCVDNISTECR